MDEQISQFSSVTGADLDKAKFFIESSNGDVGAAIAAYYESGGAESAVGGDDESGPTPTTSAPAPTPALPPASSSSGPRTLSGAPAEPVPTSSWGSQAATNTGSRKPGAGFSASGGSRGGGIATLRDYRSEQPAGRPGGSNNPNDDRDPENLYAGGERSGLSVQNPNSRRDRDGDLPDAVRKILEQAQKAGAPGGGGDDDDSDDDGGSAAGPSGSRGSGVGSLFSGAGRTIGDDSGSDHGSTQTPADPTTPRLERVERRLTFWANGFSIANGPLYPYEEERSKEILEQIDSGAAPLALFNVRMNQRVNIVVEQRRTEQYVPPPVQPFGGSGNRLGSPAPGPPASSTTAAPATSSSGSSATAPTLDESQPITSLQIRTGDGSRLLGRFNHSHTVADVRSYIDSATGTQRAYTLHTSFPPKAIEDENQTLKDAGLVNAVVIQKWQ